MGNEQWPAQRASGADNSSASTPSSQPSALDFSAVMDALATQAQQQAVLLSMLAELIEQNAQLISLITQPDEEPEVSVDLSGRPIRC